MAMLVRILVCLSFVLAACGDSTPHDPLTGASATATPRPTTWVAPVDVTFNCDPVGGRAPFKYVWDFGDGAQAAVDQPSHTYTVPAMYTASCQVTDADGKVGSTSVEFEVLAPTAHAQIDVLDTQKPSCAVTGQTVVQLSSAGSTASDGGPLASAWTLVSQPAGSTTTLSSTIGDAPTFSPDVDGDYVVRLQVVDASGLSDQAELTITSEPASRIVTVSGDGQNVIDAEPLAPVTFEVDTTCGLPVAGLTVTFAPAQGGGGTVTPDSAVTDAAGRVTVHADSGCVLGANHITATTASPALVGHAAYTNVESGPWQVLLYNPTDTPVSGQMTVRAEVLDRCRYLVTGDSTTAFTLSFHESTNDSSAAFVAVTRGTALDTSDPHAWVIRDSGGVVEATLGDTAPELVSFAMTDSQGTHLAFIVPDAEYRPDIMTVPVACNGGTMTFAFPDAPPPILGGSVEITGTLDANSLDKSLSLYTEGTTPYASVLGFGSGCTETWQTVDIDASTLAQMQLEGGITLQLKTADATQCMCATNELSVQLYYARGVAAHFTP